MSEDSRGKKSESSESDKKEIESLGLADKSEAGFARLSEKHEKKEPEKKKFIGFGQ